MFWFIPLLLFAEYSRIVLGIYLMEVHAKFLILCDCFSIVVAENNVHPLINFSTFVHFLKKKNELLLENKSRTRIVFDYFTTLFCVIANFPFTWPHFIWNINNRALFKKSPFSSLLRYEPAEVLRADLHVHSQKCLITEKCLRRHTCMWVSKARPWKRFVAMNARWHEWC